MPLKSPDEALILASIVEKETGRASDRAQIAGVFANRLRVGMLLQTDPTVIYGLGEKFDGNLRRRDLQTDTPWNTYTRPGLPPTPIAMPGKAALLAAVQPASTRALYFVAKGDGSSRFQHHAGRTQSRGEPLPAGAIAVTGVHAGRWRLMDLMGHGLNTEGFGATFWLIQSRSKASTVQASPRTSTAWRKPFRAQGRSVTLSARARRHAAGREAARAGAE